MAQILDLSKRFTKEQITKANEDANVRRNVPAGGYVCKIERAILNDDPANNKANIELHVDIAEGEYAGYFKSLEGRYGFWGLRGYLSFKEASLNQFRKGCMALCNSNPGLVFNPLAGAVDIDTLVGKQIGVVTVKEEYESNGETRERDKVYFFTEVSRIKEGKFKVPPAKKLKKDDPADFSSAEKLEIPFD